LTGLGKMKHFIGLGYLLETTFTMEKKVMNNFVVCLRHDKGKVKLTLSADNTDKVIAKAMRLEKAPKSAVLWVKKG
jgi:hypothetical protein